MDKMLDDSVPAQRESDGDEAGGIAKPDQTTGQIVLVFQGGGALGAYQAGVYQALHEAEMEPDWIIGTSIGAINASLIAGNEPENRLAKLQDFWGRMARKEIWRTSSWPGSSDPLSYWATVLGGIPGFFEPNSPAFFGAHVRLGPDNAGYYSTAPLEKTLAELVEFSLIRRCSPRLTIGAAHVCTGQMRYFDSRVTEMTAKHIMASRALPPAVPAVRIDGELYWDGGILSNTPTEAILEDNPRHNSLIFAVHVWSPLGPEPGTIWEVLHRQKEIQYSSRVASHIARQRQVHKLRHVVSELVKFLPQTDRTIPLCKTLRSMGVRPKCMSSHSSHRNSTAKITQRMWISAPPAFAYVGKPVMPTPAVCWNERRGKTNLTRLRE